MAEIVNFAYFAVETWNPWQYKVVVSGMHLKSG